MTRDDALTLPEVMVRSARQFGDAPAIVSEASDGGATLSYRQLEQAVHEATAALLASGVGKGDRVGLWAPNSARWIIAALAIECANAILVPLNTRMKGKEAAYILGRTRTKLLFTVDEFLGSRYPELLAQIELPALERTVLLNGDNWTEFLSQGKATQIEGTHAARSAVADIMFTSGTTGQPKGVMSTHEQNVRVSTTWGETVGLRKGDRYLIVNPFFHTFGYKAGWLACLIQGAVIYPMAVFDTAKVLATIEREGITVLTGAPTVYQSLLAHEALARTDLSSLRLAVTGAATVPPILIRRMRTELHFKSVLTAYGLTECTGVVTMCPHDASDEIVATRCGVAIPGVEVQCVDEAGNAVPVDEPGEVVVRGYNVMLGYFEDPEATAAAIDGQGWFHTGDIGVLDAQGFLRITDRKKDLFIVGGFNCYPAEIEKILSEHPAVAQVAVIGVPDERMGEVGKAYIVLRPGAAATAAEIISWSRENMANYKVPRYVEFPSALPANASGKVQKFTLRESQGS